MTKKNSDYRESHPGPAPILFSCFQHLRLHTFLKRRSGAPGIRSESARLPIAPPAVS
jgi:hypothetical protein